MEMTVINETLFKKNLIVKYSTKLVDNKLADNTISLSFAQLI